MDQRVDFTQRFISAVRKSDEERTKEDYDYIVYVLKKLPEFHTQDENDLRVLAKVLTTEVVDRDSILYDTDSIATCWYYILSGSVLISNQLFLNGMSIGKGSYDNYYRNEMCLVLEQTELLKFTYPNIAEQHLSSTPTTGSSGQQSPEAVLPGFTRSCSPPKNASDIYDMKNSVSSLPIYPITDHQQLEDVDGKMSGFPNSISDGNIVELSITEPSDHNLLTDSKCNRETIDLFDLAHFIKPREATRDSTISGASLDEVFSNSPISRRVSCPVKVSMQRSISNDSLDKAYESSVIVDDDLSFSARSNDDSELASSYRNSKKLEVPRPGGSMSSLLSDEDIYPVDRHSELDSDEESEMSEGSSGTLDCVLTCLSKPSHERTEEDIEGLLDVLAMLPAFSKLTSAVRRSILKLMVLKTVEEDNTVIINNGEDVDCWYVVLNGYLRYCREQEQEKHLHVGESYGINQSLKVVPHSGKLMASKDCQYGYLHITEFSQIIHEGEENIKRETDEDGQLVRVMELRSAGNKRKGYFLIQATPEKLLDHLLEATVDDSYHADFLLTYRTFLTSPGEIFDKLLTNWNERAEVHDQIISIVLHWVTNHYGDFDGDDEMTGFLDRFEELLKGEGRLGPLRALDLARTTYSRPRSIELEREAAKSAIDFQVGGGIDLSRPIFVISVLVGSSAHQKGLRVGDELLSINGSDCTKMTLVKAQRLLQNNYKLELSVKSNFPGYKNFVRNTPSSVIDQMDSATTVQTRNNTPAPPPMRPRVASVQLKTRVGSNSSKESGTSPKLKLKDPVKILRSVKQRVTKEVNKAIKRQSTYDPDHAELHPPRPRSASSMHATSVERRPSGKKKVPLAKRASVDDIATYSVDVPDGEVKHSSSVGNLNTIDLTEPVTTVTGTTNAKGTVVDAVIKLYTLDHSYKYISVSQKTTVGEVIERAVREFYPDNFCENVRQEYCIAVVTVAGRDGPVRNSVLPEHLADLPNFIGLSSRYYLKKRDTLATLIQDEVQQEMIKESKIHKQILKLDPLVIAQEFTRIDSLVFTEIDATEYLDDLWGRDGPHMHLHITKFEEMTNNHLYWTVTTILQEQCGTRRAEIVKHMIKIARYLKDLRNFNTMFAILSGLNHSLVQRLKPTWEKVPGKYRKMKKDLEIFMDPTRNFVKYRNLLKGSDRPLIPYFPVAKKDLTFIYLGNDSMVENMVNFEKLRMIAREVKNCKQYCLTPIMPPPVEAVTVHLGTPPKSLHGSLRIKFKSPTAYQATVNSLKRVYIQHQMRKRVKAFVEQPYIITDEGHLDVLFKILMTVNTHKKDKKPDSPSSRHRTARQSSIPSSIPSPKQGSLSSDSPPPSPKRTNTLGRNSKLTSFGNGPHKANNKRAVSPKIYAPL